MPHAGFANPITNDGPGFHSNMLDSELTERDTRSIKASVISLAPSIAETIDGVMHEIWLTPTKPNDARGLKPPDPNSGIQLTGVRRLAHKGFEAAPRRTEPGEKT